MMPPKKIRYGRSRELPLNVDLGLAVLCAVRDPGETFTFDQIAEACGCTNGNILLIQQRALRKLRNRLNHINRIYGEELKLCIAKNR